MDFNPDISKLEKAVDTLLAKYNVLKNECDQLTLDLAESRTQFDALKEEKRLLLNEKETVHSKVTSILGKLSEWEDGLMSQPEPATPESTEESRSQLFNMSSS